MRFRLAMGFPAVVLSTLMVGACLAGEPVKSGLSPGDSVNPFLVEDITGPNKGNTLCYR